MGLLTIRVPGISGNNPHFRATTAVFKRLSGGKGVRLRCRGALYRTRIQSGEDLLNPLRASRRDARHSEGPALAISSGV